MSELWLSSRSRTHLSSRLKSDFFLFCSFILSHPLHFTFFIFFSPYIHRLLSFLFPLFVTTSLFLLAFLTFIPNFIHEKQSSEIKVSFLTATYRAIVETLRSKIDNQREEYLRLEDFEVFRIVFDNPTIHDANVDQAEVSEAESTTSSFQESPVFACFDHQDFSLSSDEALASKTDLDGYAELKKSNWGAMEDDKELVSLWEELDDFEDATKVTTSVEKKKIVAPICTGANKAIEKQGEKSQVSNGSEAAGDKIRRNNSVGKEKGREYKSKLLKVHSHSIGASADYTNDGGDYSLRIQSSPSVDYCLGSYGSMRKEKEWKRTLACKLFEERNNNNADESEGMDLLWETYEMESAKNKAKSKNNNIKKKKSQNKHEIKHREEDEIDRDRQGDEEDDSDGQLCCLQALKFSTGKMNLGMGRPNLVKISKAIKGIGWLHSLRRHSKKVHNGDKY